MSKEVQEGVRGSDDQDDASVLSNRKWPAFFTADQMRAQMRHEEAGCPVPFEGAVWNGYTFVGAR